MGYRSVTDGDRRPTGHALVDRIAATLQRPRAARARSRAARGYGRQMLAAEFEVSRTPVREALRKLQADGIVELEPHRGAVVRSAERRARSARRTRFVPSSRASRRSSPPTGSRSNSFARLHEAGALFRLLDRRAARASPWRRRRTPRRDRGLDARERRLPPGGARGRRQREAAPHDWPTSTARSPAT